MASDHVRVVETCSEEFGVISTFIEFFLALPDVDSLLLVDP